LFELLKTEADLSKLEIIAKKIAKKVKKGDIFLLNGELGAGKTTFARFFINYIFKKNSLSPPNSIKSPSFPIMINYSIPSYEIYHYDLYRLKSEEEIEELNFYENFKENITLIEWPEIIANKNKLIKYYNIKMDIINQTYRSIKIYHTHIKNF
tara:strand:+ start:701 stop:1159 length:459 start_codon:yes stop_codon:yes gene_type:complete